LLALVDLIHPQKAVKEKPADLPDHMPLKILLLGQPFSGRKALASLLQKKYGLETIDPLQVIADAINVHISYIHLLQTVFPPEVVGKKPPKKETKGQEPVKEINPEIVDLATQGRDLNLANSPFSDDLLVAAIKLQLKTVFPLISDSQLFEDVKQADLKEK